MEVTTAHEDGVAVLEVRGGLVAGDADRLGDAFGDLLAGGERDFVVDMTDVGVLDSAGLATLIGMFTRVRIGPGDVRLCGLTPWVKVVFVMTRLIRVFSCFDNRAAAVASFRPAAEA